MTGVGLEGTLYRSRIKSEGRALFEADFYIPAKEQKLPSIAILAMEPLEPGKTTPRSFYRFGFTKGTMLYFSFINPTNKNNPLFYYEKKMVGLLKRPGWHRILHSFRGTGNHPALVDEKNRFFPHQGKNPAESATGLLLADTKITPYKFDNMTI